MAEKYTAEGHLASKMVTDPGGNEEVVLLCPIPKRVRVDAVHFLALVEEGKFAAGQLVFAGKNGKAEYALVGADKAKRAFLLDLIHDNVHDTEA